MHRLSLVAATVAAVLLPAAPASAGDPIMPLSQVRSGMQCEALSVIRGTEPVPFNVQIEDVIDGDPSLVGPRILISVSGPAIDPTGLGPGFSGSPVYCPDAQGVRRVVGAISESVGEYGGTLGLATPIEEIVAVRTRAPGARPRGRASRLPGRALSLAAPLTISGVSGPVARALMAEARRQGRPLQAAPAGPAGSFPRQTLRPGSAMAVGLSSGDINLAAIGTVAYVDADRVWGFGHSLEATGARSLFLQDAYVFRVIENPNVGGDAGSTYKLAVPGHNLGTIGNDELSAVAGTLGGLPRTIGVHIYGEDGDTRRKSESHSLVADESPVVGPGASGATFVAPVAVSQLATTLLRSAPGNLYGRMCATVRLAELKKPLRICNRYVSAGPDASGIGNVVAERAASDVADALSIIDSYRLGILRVEDIGARLTLRRGVRLAYLRSVEAPRRAKAGEKVRLKVTTELFAGPRRTRTVTVRLPDNLKRGVHRLRLRGAGPDSGGDLFSELFEDFIAEIEGSGDGAAGPATVQEVARRVRSLSRFDGVRMKVGRGRGPGVPAFRDKDFRIAGQATTRLRIVR